VQLAAENPVKLSHPEILFRLALAANEGLRFPTRSSEKRRMDGARGVLLIHTQAFVRGVSPQATERMRMRRFVVGGRLYTPHAAR
jgi:hypothetical protein